MANRNTDLTIIGGGLSGLLTAFFRLTAHPGETITIIEGKDDIAGDHTWSFFQADISDEAWAKLQPFIRYHWPSYEVRFPTYRRTLNNAYASGDSASLKALIAPLIENGSLKILTSKNVVRTTPEKAVLDDSDEIAGSAVIDARGGRPGFLKLGYQKFIGHVIRTEKPHGRVNPIIMDAEVEQLGGYRFVYCLPYGDDRLLVEDTRYTNGDDLDRDAIEKDIANYIASCGWKVAEVERREEGVLPITLAANVEAAIADEQGAAPRIGLAGGLFNAATGYSLPHAVALAQRLAAQPVLTPSVVQAEIHGYRRENSEDEAYYRLLNRMLFVAAGPMDRRRVMQRFYTLNEGLIRRFYAYKLKSRDKARIMFGKPPVNVFKALSLIDEKPFIPESASL